MRNRKHSWIGARILLVTLSALVFGMPRGTAAQTYWRVPAGLGGAMVGAGAGWMIDIARWAGTNSDAFAGPSLVATPIGMVAGGIAGFAGGLAADRRLARGDSLSRGARGTLRIATFLAPVAVGSAVTFIVVNPSDDGRCVPYDGPYNGCRYEPPPPKAMSDEMVALLGIGGGAVIGFVLQHRYARALRPGVRVGVTRDLRGVLVSVPLGW